MTSERSPTLHRRRLVGAIGAVTCLFTVVEVSAQVDSTLARVRSAGITEVEGAHTLLVSPGHIDRARELDRLLADADRHLAASLGVEADFAIAVLDEEAWGRVWPGPYGVPYVSLTPPWVVVMPASLESSVLMAPFEELMGAAQARVTIDNIGFHEVGHVYVSAFFPTLTEGEAPPVRWLDEFLASYLAYGFLDAVSPERGAVWRSFTDGVLAGPAPRFTRLADFEAEYYGYLGTEEGSLNYSWYQAAFLDLVARVHAEKGMDFMRELRFELAATSSASIDTHTVVDVLHAMTPVFRTWLDDFGLADPPRP